MSQSQTIGTYLGYNNGTTAATTTGDLNFNFRFSIDTVTTAGTACDTNWVSQPVYQLGSELPVFTVQIPIHTGGYQVIGGTVHDWHTVYPDDPKTLEEKLQARAKSMELLQDWLTAKEYRALTDQGELEIPSAVEADVVFLVKRDPMAKVVKKVKGKPTEMLCVVPEEPGYADGDVLLSKIMMLKTEPAKFQKLANRYPIGAYA